MDDKQFHTMITNLINLEAHMPEMSPLTPRTNPPRSLPDVIDSILRNLEMARDCTALKLASLKPGSSAEKSTKGYLRGLQESITVIRTEWGAGT